MMKNPLCFSCQAAVTILVVFLTFLSVADGVEILVPPYCHWNPFGSLKPVASTECPKIVDDEVALTDNAWPPWTFKPECKRLPNGSEVNKYCLFTYSGFHGNRDVSLITAPEVAANEVGAITEAGILWEAIGTSPGSATTNGIAPIYEVKELPGKGKGIVARRKIRRGEVLMIDPVSLVVAVEYMQSLSLEERRVLLERGVDQLSDEHASLVMSLAADTGGHPIEDILRTNSFEISLSNAYHLGLFTELSRINHSCKPNSFTRFSQSTLAFEIVATQDIQPGDEITISYTPLGATEAERKDRLKKWGFPCKCPLCSASAKNRTMSDKRRIRIFQIWDEIEVNMQSNRDKVGSLTEELLQLVETEELTARIGEFYGELANIFYFMDDTKSAKKYAKLALGYWLVFDSVQQHHVHNIQAFLAQLEDD